MKEIFNTSGTSTGPTAFEVQLHPADIRKRVRYLFLDWRQVALLAGMLFLFAAFLASALFALPSVVREFLQRGDYHALHNEHAQQGRRLQALVERLEEIRPRGKELRLESEKLLLAYGLPSDESAGQGGFPPAPVLVPESEYQDNVRRGQTLITETQHDLRVVSVFVDEITGFQRDFSEQVRTTPSILPMKEDSFVLTSPFGERSNPFTQNREHHAGLDLAASQGTPIYATADGVVVFAGRYPKRQSIAWWHYGNLVVVRHNESFVTLYGHCHEVKVRQNQQVKRGDLLATVGSTGWSTSPHLHYEVRRRNQDGEAIVMGNDSRRFVPVDPRIYILDYRWDDQERLLIRARRSPMPQGYEPLPGLFVR